MRVVDFVHLGSRARRAIANQPRASRRRVALGLLVLLSAALGACSRAASYRTELSTTRGLASGGPVMAGGTRIGQVTAIDNSAGGDSAVSFSVERAHAGDVRSASIAVLNTDPGPARLEILNPDPLAPPAPEGATIDGAISPEAARGLIAKRGIESFAVGLAAALSGFAAGAAAANSADWDKLQNDLLRMQRAAAANGARSAEALARQWEQVAREIAGMQQQLLREGKSAEAERLRRELESFGKTRSAPPNTLTIPPAR